MWEEEGFGNVLILRRDFEAKTEEDCETMMKNYVIRR